MDPRGRVGITKERRSPNPGSIVIHKLLLHHSHAPLHTLVDTALNIFLSLPPTPPGLTVLPLIIDSARDPLGRTGELSPHSRVRVPTPRHLTGHQTTLLVDYIAQGRSSPAHPFPLHHSPVDYLSGKEIIPSRSYTTRRSVDESTSHPEPENEINPRSFRPESKQFRSIPKKTKVPYIRSSSLTG